MDSPVWHSTVTTCVQLSSMKTQEIAGQRKMLEEKVYTILHSVNINNSSSPNHDLLCTVCGR